MSDIYEYLGKIESVHSSVDIIKSAISHLKYDMGQMQYLDNIDKNINSLLQQNYNAGLRFLRDADQVKSKSLRDESLRNAKDSFIEGAFVGSNYSRAKSLQYAGLCYELLGEKKLAADYYNESCTAMDKAKDEAKKTYENKKTIAEFSDLGLAVLGAITVVGLLPAASRVSKRAKNQTYAKKWYDRYSKIADEARSMREVKGRITNHK